MLEFSSEIQTTQKGADFVEYIKSKYSDSFAKAKFSKDDKERLKALDDMAFLDEIIEIIKD